MSDTPSRYAFGRFRLDTLKRRLVAGDRTVTLTGKAFDLLVVLIERRDRVVSTNELLDLLWANTAVDESNLTVTMSTLRKALGDTASKPAYIVTVPGRGYRFIAGLSIDPPSNRRERTPKGLVPRLLSRVTIRHVLRAAGMIVLLAAMAGAASLIVRRPFTAASGPARLAVLPFQPVGLADDDRFLGLAMADAVITRLSGMDAIDVRPTSAVRQFEQGAGDVVELGRRLGVSSLLHGSVQKNGDAVRVTVQLVAVDSGATLWAQAFEHQSASVFDLENEIATRVADSLRLRLEPTDRARIQQRYTTQSDAYRAYLKGRYYWNKHQHADYRTAMTEFQRALDLDPGYAPAYAGLADCLVFLSDGEPKPAEMILRAEAAAKRALELDPLVTEAHASLAFVAERHHWDRRLAAREYERAIELNPNYATAHDWYGLFLAEEGRFDEALSEIDRARALDPLAAVMHMDRAWVLLLMRRHFDALASANLALELDPGFLSAKAMLGAVLALSGRHAEGEKTFADLVTAAGNSPTAKTYQAIAMAMGGKRDAARAMVPELEKAAKETSLVAYYLGALYAHLGDDDDAARWITVATDRRVERLVWLKVDPLFASVRSHPDVQRVITRLGL